MKNESHTIGDYLYPKTLDEAIDRWDNGESLFSIEMGGMGPGYEQAIQVTAMELIREFKDEDIDWESDKIVTEINEKLDAFRNDIISGLGLSGAQFGAAKNIYCVFKRHGWEKGVKMAPEDRRIQISKNFPG